MYKKELVRTAWSVKFSDPESGIMKTIPACVPGNVIGDLVRAGEVRDPYWGSEVLKFRKYEYIDWEYQTELAVPEFLPGEKLELVLGGVDTVAEYYLDGRLIGKSANMFIEQRLDLTAQVMPGSKHDFKVILRSPVTYARQFEVPPQCHTQDFNFDSLFVRKARHSYGWDILPRLTGAGLWRAVWFEIHPATEWYDLYFQTLALSPGEAFCNLYWNFRTPEKKFDGFEAELEMVCGTHRHVEKFTPRFKAGQAWFFLPDPQLWYPAGEGAQNIYDATLRLFHNGQPVAVETMPVAIRTVKLDYQEKAEGAPQDRFDFIINGARIPVRGMNWVPVDALHGEHHEKMLPALEAAKELHCNMVRCWGGGVYEDHDFFDWCDRNGMLVWQDFMLACECPPMTPEFMTQMREEAVSVVKKLRNHPSLVFWSGDNECDSANGWNPGVPPSSNKITREIFPEALQAYAPGTPYLPSSPYLSDKAWKMNMPTVEQHPWGDRYNWKSDYYTANKAAFVSEIGYPGLTALESLRKFLPPESLNMEHWHPADMNWKVHSTQPFGVECPSYTFRTELEVKALEQGFGKLPGTLEEAVVQSQALHAEAMKFFAEQVRLRQAESGGILLWNLMDGWPSNCNEALLDYYQCRKPAFQAVQEAFSPLVLIVPEPVSWRTVPVFVNDLNRAAAGHYRISDLVTDRLVAEGDYQVGAHATLRLHWFDTTPAGMRFLLLEWDDQGEKYVSHALLGQMPFDYELYARCRAQYLAKAAQK